MPQPPDSPRRLALTRRGRLLRSALVLLTVLILALTVTLIVRSFAAELDPTVQPAPSATVGTESADSPAAEAPTDSATATMDAEPSTTATGGEKMTQSGTVGDGTWTFAPVTDDSEPADGTVHTYAVRVENGTGIDADETAQEVATILADPRGWQGTEGVVFQQVESSDAADVTISIGSPPTVDELCLPAKTQSTWNCRVGSDVALNSDRWLYKTPTYDDLTEYRAYMVNHEVGHFLGHDHVSCGGKGENAPVMLQQSMGLDGCLPNAWPTRDASR